MKGGVLLLSAASLLASGHADSQELDAELAQSGPGQVVQIGLASASDFRLLSYNKLPLPGAHLLLSDNPEYFTQNGIGLQEEIAPGRTRLYVYNCAESPDGSKKTITAVLENTGDGSLRLEMVRRGLARPSNDYYAAAKEGLIDFFGSTPAAAVREVPPGGRIVVDSELDNTLAASRQLVHGIFEFVTDQPARISVFQKDPADDSLTVLDGLPKLAASGGAGRGLFPSCCFEVTATVDTADGLQQLVVADGKTDPWVEGTDALSGGVPVLNRGNYGVIYRMILQVRSSDGRKLAILICRPQTNNPWCSATAAAVMVDGQVIALPERQVTFRALPEAVLVWKVGVPPGEEKRVDIIYSPPGASCLPTPLLLVPYRGGVP